MNEVNYMQEFVKDKNVILVGNSVEIMEYDLKEYIDSFDIVVHFGKAIGRNSRQDRSLGTKTDIWVTGIFRSPMWGLQKPEFTTGRYKDTKIVLNRCRRLFREHNVVFRDDNVPNFEAEIMFSDDEFVDIYDEFGFGEDKDGLKRPSAGFLTILFFTRKIKTHKRLHLIGFDFFAKSTDAIRPGCKIPTPHSWHLPLYTIPVGSHNIGIEQGYVRKLEREGTLTWHVLSDLRKETVKYSNWLRQNDLDSDNLKKIKINDQDTFLNHRREQEAEHFNKNTSNDPLSSILTVELNTTELCNRKCVFCPRYDSDVYPNRNLNMTVETAEIIAKNLSNFNYTGKISYSGYSENFLNKKFLEIINVMRKYLKTNLFECNTNGDFLKKDSVGDIFKSGLDLLYINLYDGIDQIQKFDDIMENIDESKYKYRAHYSQKDYGLKINNRGGNITWLGFDESDIESLKGKPCHYPFYKLFVDWNGDVLFCANDWGKEIIVGNLTKQTLQEVWLSDKMYEIRQKLAVGDRSFSPCNSCSVNGQLFGKKSFDILNKYYESSDNG